MPPVDTRDMVDTSASNNSMLVTFMASVCACVRVQQQARESACAFAID